MRPIPPVGTEISRTSRLLLLNSSTLVPSPCSSQSNPNPNPAELQENETNNIAKLAVRKLIIRTSTLSGATDTVYTSSTLNFQHWNLSHDNISHTKTFTLSKPLELPLMNRGVSGTTADISKFGKIRTHHRLSSRDIFGEPSINTRKTS